MKKTYIYNYKFNSVFVKTFIILIISSIIPVLTANIFIYKQSISKIQNQVNNTNINMLTKTSETVDLVFNQVEQTIKQLSNDVNIMNFVINPNRRFTTDTNFATRDNNIINYLKNVSSANSYIHSIYLYSTFNDTVLSSNGGAYTIKDFFDTQWVESYNNYFEGTYQLKTRKVIDSEGKEANCITLIRNLPYGTSRKLVAVVVNINEDTLYNTIAGLDTKNNGEIYVVSKNGVVLSHKTKYKINYNLNSYEYIKKILKNDNGFFTEKVDGKKIIFTYVTSKNYGWKYIYTIPLGELYNDSAVISQLIFGITFIYILIALFLSFLITRGIYIPIENLMNIVSSSSKNISYRTNSSVKNEYDFLGHAYSDVVDKNKNMETIIENAKPVIKEKLFTNLIMGKNNNLADISEKLNILNLNFSLSNYMVIAIQIDNYSELKKKYSEIDSNLLKIKLIDIIGRIITSRHNGVCVETEVDKVAVIINYIEDIPLINAKEDSLLLAKDIKCKIEKYFPFTITLGIGRMYKDILNIKLSYKEAINALKFKLFQGKNEIINIDDVDLQDEELYYYYSEKEKMLINNLKVGQYDEVEKIIDELTQEILDYRSTSYTYVRQVFIRIINSIIELIINMGININDVFNSKNLYEELSSKETIEDIKTWLSEVCNTTICAINKDNNTKSQKNAEKILEYVNNNLHHEISLNDIADWIGFSTAYVSKVFKENIGKNYIHYLNESRIEKAKQLLKSTKLTIKEVGFRVGFNNIQTFMRTFKKYEGITPGQYRDKT